MANQGPPQAEGIGNPQRKPGQFIGERQWVEFMFPLLSAKNSRQTELHRANAMNKKTLVR